VQERDAPLLHRIHNMENMLEYYYEKLEKENRPGVVITRFYAEMFSQETSKKEIIMFNRLIKIYGRFIVFFAVLDVEKVVKDGRYDNIFGLLHTLCKSRFERAHPNSNSPTSKVIRTTILENEIEKAGRRKIKTPNLSDLDAS